MFMFQPKEKVLCLSCSKLTYVVCEDSQVYQINLEKSEKQFQLMDILLDKDINIVSYSNVRKQVIFASLYHKNSSEDKFYFYSMNDYSLVERKIILPRDTAVLNIFTGGGNGTFFQLGFYF